MIEEVNQIVEYLREDACCTCIFNSFIGECTSLSSCMNKKAADLIESLSAQLEQVTRERDAAVKDMKIIRSCRQCKTWQEYFKDNGDVSPCENCDMYSNWQWRGVEVEG